MKPNIRTLLSTSALIVCLTGFCSCSNNTNSDKSIIDVASVVGKGSVHNASEFIEDIKYVTLETNQNSLIGLNPSIRIENNKIYLSDMRHIITIFDMNGRHLNTLNRLGRGDQEYPNIVDFAIIPNGNILILSWSGEMLEYDEDLNFVRRITPEEPIAANYLANFTLLQNGLFVSYTRIFGQSGTEEGLLVYDESFKTHFSYKDDYGVSKQSIQHDGYFPTVGNIRPYNYYLYNNDLTVYRVGNDTIFGINIQDNYSKYVRYFINYGVYTNPALITSKSERVPEDANIIQPLSIDETDHYLFFGFDFNGLAPEVFETDILVDSRGTTIKRNNTNVYAIYDKKSGELILLNQPSTGSLGLKDDLKGGPPFWPGVITAKQELVTWHNAHDLISLAEEGKIDKSLVANLKEGDNPIIVIATPK